MSSLRRAIRLAFWAAVAVSCSTWAQDIGSIYAANCANCHGADGRGNTVLGRALKIRDLRSGEVQKLSKTELVAIISRGAGKGKMPGFEKKLGAETVRRLAIYLSDPSREPAPAAQERQTARSEPLDAKDIYAARCAHCHAADGSGNTILGKNLKLRDIRSPEAQKSSDAELIAIITGGMDRGRMPGFRKKLDPGAIEQLASHVRQLAGRPPVQVAKLQVNTKSLSMVTPAAPTPAVRAEVKPLLGAPSGPSMANAPAEPGPESAIQQQQSPQSAAEAERGTNKRSRPARLASFLIPAPHKKEAIDLNSASKEQLMTLPGITEADAANIIAHRPYKSGLQFRTRRIISQEQYARIAGRIVARQPRTNVQPPLVGEPQQ